MPAGIPVTFTEPDDWSVDAGFMAYHDSAGVLFDDISNIYTDGCQWVLLDPPVGPTVDDLVAAWANLPDFAATAAVDVTVDGYPGKQIEFTVPDYNMGECKELQCTPSGICPASVLRTLPATGRKAPTSTSRCGSSTSTAPGS